MDDDIVINVEHLSKTFKLPHEKTNSLKSSVVNFYKRDKGYEKQEALKDVSFNVKKGEFFGIVGRNGSGKSTLLKTLAGIYSPDKGSISVKGKLIPFIELGVGFSPELSGRDNVFLNGSLIGFSRKEMKAMYNEIVEFAELERFMDQKLKNYSSGMQVRLAFSIAIRARSDILLLDEVLAVGDATFQQKCYDYFEELKLDKKTVIFVSHDMSAVKRFCNRAIYINKGKLLETGSAIDIADKYQDINTQSILKERDQAVNTDRNIRVDILDQNTESRTVKFRISYSNPRKVKAFMGFSILRDGVTVAELNNLNQANTKAKGAVEYTLDTTRFNPGLYEISATLLGVDNKQPLYTTRKRAKFYIEGHDLNRGGAVYLDDTFSAEAS